MVSFFDVSNLLEGVSQNLRIINGYFKTTSSNLFDNYMNIFHRTKVQTYSAPQNDRLNLSLHKKCLEGVIKRSFIIRKFWETPSTKVFITCRFNDKILGDHFLVHESCVIMMLDVPQEPKSGHPKFYH